MHDALVERTGVVYDPFTPEQQSGISGIVERFIDAKEESEEDVISFVSVRQMMEICKQFKRLVLQTRGEVDAAREETASIAHSVVYGSSSRGVDKTGDFGLTAETKLADDYDPRKQSYVGVAEQNKGGFPLGVAASHSRPLQGLDIVTYAESKFGTKASSSIAKESNKSPNSPLGMGRSELNVGSMQSPVFAGDDQAVMFENFSNNEGAELHGAFVDAKNLIRTLRANTKDLSTAVNSAKSSIDDLQRKMQVRKESRIEMLKRSGFKASEAEDIVDEEELSLMRDLKEAKRAYKSSYEMFHRQKDQLDEAQNRAEAAKTNLTSAFLSWTSAKAGENEYYPESLDGSDQLDNQESFDKMETQRVLSRFPGILFPFCRCIMRLMLCAL